MKKNNSKIIKLSGTIMSVLLSLQFAQASEITGTINTTLGTNLTAVVLTPRSITTPPPSGGGGGGGSSGGNYSGGGGGGGGLSSYYLSPSKNENKVTTVNEIKKTQMETNNNQEKSTGKISNSIPTFNFTNNLKLGSNGNDVKELQKILIKNGLLNSEATGYFGKLTKDALIKWQKKNKIKTTGVLDRDTIALLSPIPTEITQAIPVSKISNIPTYIFSKDISIGSKNNDVKELQKILIADGVLKTKATGYFGDATKKAIKVWQTKNNLPITGIFDQTARNYINKTK